MIWGIIGKDLLDWVEVRAVWRKEQEPCANASDRASDSRSLVAGEIIHDDNIACQERWDEALFDIVKEAIAIDRPIHDTRC